MSGRKSQLSMSSSTVNEIVVVKPSEEQVKVCKSWLFGVVVYRSFLGRILRERRLSLSGKCKVIPDDRLPPITLEAGVWRHSQRA